MADDILNLVGKKKKAKKPIMLDEPSADAPTGTPDPGTEELVLGLKKKKKTVKPSVLVEEQTQEKDVEPYAQGIGMTNLIDAKGQWPNYSYDQLLELIFGIMKEKNPELAAGEKKKFIMKPPQVS